MCGVICHIQGFGPPSSWYYELICDTQLAGLFFNRGGRLRCCIFNTHPYYFHAKSFAVYFPQ